MMKTKYLASQVLNKKKDMQIQATSFTEFSFLW